MACYKEITRREHLTTEVQIRVTKTNTLFLMARCSARVDWDSSLRGLFIIYLNEVCPYCCTLESLQDQGPSCGAEIGLMYVF